jgi:ribosomal protein L11 methyltransferase
VIRLALRVRRADAEIVLAELLVLAPAGVEERDVDDDVVEYAVYGAPGELPELPDLRAAAGGALVEVTTTEVPDDWDERWKAFHRPVQVGDLLIRPPWAPRRDGLRDVVIDPAQAFGTGAHPTTRLCLDLMLDLEPTGAFVDVGCGSGVLAIAARRLGFDPVWALDADPLAVDATLANARRNRVGLRVARRVVGADRLPVAGTVTANLTATVLVALAEHLPEPAPRRLVASGMRPEEVAGVAGAFARRDLRPSGEVVEDGWATVLLERP